MSPHHSPINIINVPRPDIRYRLLRNPEKFGQTVFNHIQHCKDQLMKEESNRQPWLKLIKELADYANLMRRMSAASGIQQ